MDQQRQQLVERLKAANNILVTVSSNPSVDQLSAAIGLTILLNKLKKHATAVYSGATPSTIEFLQPEDTLEKTTDSLRDFIISLDKSKADKLRYKVDNDANVVRIFITPYKTSINQDDLDFSQGDFNVDVVVAIGVSDQQDLDQAITAHGRILHDATVTTINTHPGGELGSINYVDPAASSLSELTTDVADILGHDLIDGQIATALLTGIVAETDRFSNERTTPETMRLSAALMTAGANQQLVATSLEAAMEPAITRSAADDHSDSVAPPSVAKPDDGTLEITHQPDEEHHEEQHQEQYDEPTPESQNESQDTDQSSPQPEPQDEDPKIGDVKQTNFGDGPNASDGIALLPPSQASQLPPPRFMTEPPRAGGMLTANTQEEDLVEESRDPFGILLPEEPEVYQPPLSTKPPLTIASNTNPVTEPEPEQPAEPEEPKQPWTPRTLPVTVVEPEPVLAPTPEPKPALAPFVAPATVPAPTPVAAAEPIPDLSLPPVATTAPISAAPPIQLAPPSTVGNTLSDLEQAVHSPHAIATPAAPVESLDAARDAVMSAINSAPLDANAPQTPKADIGASGYLNVQDLPGMSSPTLPTPPAPAAPVDVAPVAASPADKPLDMPLPPSANASSTLPLPAPAPSPLAPAASGPTPPPVPPPMTELPPL